MLLKHLKQLMILPKKEVLINKVANIRGIDVLLISITLEENKIVLWTMHKPPCNVYERIDIAVGEHFSSNREKIINSITRQSDYSHINISEMTIQGQKLVFSSSHSSLLHHTNCNDFMKIQHFVENGMDTTDFDEVDVSSIYISAYEHKGCDGFPEIDLSKELDITLKLNKEHKQVLINQPMRVEFGEMPKGNKLYFYDSVENKNRIFYINKVEHYDIWKDAEEKFSKNIHMLPKEELEQVKTRYLAYLEETCPKGMDLAMLEYETEDNIQLEFYSKEYMDKKPVCSSSATGIMFGSNKKLGINGFENRLCMIKPVEKDSNGSIDVELFAWYMEIPEAIVTIK